ncbi:hypothetical protein O9993_12120 [Vibrio lentus]|nr:hypothetical protein [Vibrio lentus]
MGILGTNYLRHVMADAIKGDTQSELYAVAGRTEKALNEVCSAVPANIDPSTGHDALIEDQSVSRHHHLYRAT